MQPELYLDPSALVKLYFAEPETAALSDFVRRHRPPLPFSSLHELELTHALERRKAEGDLEAVELNRIRALLEMDLAHGLLVRPEADWSGTFARGIHLLKKHPGLRSLDSLHIGSALETKSPWFVTFDQRQARAAAAEGLKLWPAES